DYVAHYPDYAKAHPEIARNGFASLPLLLDGRCTGAIVLGFEDSFDFTVELRAFLIALADQCSIALERARHLEEEQDLRRSAERAVQRVDRLQGFTSALAQAMTPVDVMDAVVDLGTAAAGAQSGALWLLSADDARV